MRMSHRQPYSEQQTAAAMEAMSELEFMDHILEQLLTGQYQPLIRLTDADLEAIEAEHIGEHFLRYPFLY